jgi:outer membrane protein OmpA-like peptidoglycan-associated protein
MIKKNYLLTTFLILMLGSTAYAQDGDSYYEDKDYNRAVFAYQREVASEPSKYLNLAKSYFAIHNFEKAIDAMKAYREQASESDRKIAAEWISLLERDDEVVRVENMGGVVNDQKENFLPRILSDGKTLYFLSRDRSGGQGGEDIWYSLKDDNGKWTEPKNLSSLNSSSHEGILAISPDEKVAILFGNFEGSFGGGDLFYSVRTDNGWTPPCNLGGSINSERWESLAGVGPDGKTLIYTTNMKDGNGSDLFVTQLSENGWSKPVNLGSTVNTSKEEKYPFLAADGKTLYFSSTGHGGFGGYDVFMTKRLDDSWTNWSKPVNLGKYINTLEDDADLSIPASGKLAYIVRANAPDGYGQKDIYSFLMPFNMRPEQVFTLYGQTFDENDSAVEVNIRFIDMETKKEVTKATSKSPLGKYTAALPLNRKYLAVVDMKGFLYYSEVIDLTNPDLYRSKDNFQKRIAQQSDRLNALKAQMDGYNDKLQDLNSSGSQKIKETFIEYERLVKSYQKALDELNSLIYRAKYDWMTSDEEDLSLEKDFHLQTIKLGAKFELKNIFFDVGKASLRKESIEELDKLYDIMKNSEIVIELGGHTDSTGTKEGNKRLSQERVNSVKTYLADKGINVKRIEAVGYGDEQPVATNKTEEGRQLNRRVEVKILKLQYDQEGSDVVTDADRNKKQVQAEKAIQKGEMLPILQAAARKGGLPSGSDCNNITYIPPKPNPNPRPGPSPNPLFDKTPLERKQNLYKAFNVSLLNWGYNTGDLEATGASMIITSKKLRETHIEAYYDVQSNDDQMSNSNPIGGIGLAHYYIQQLKPTIGLPINVFSALDAKAFVWDDTLNSETNVQWNVNFPIGMRYIASTKKGGVVLAPEFSRSLGIARNRDMLNNRTGHWKLGIGARWKLFHGGLYFHRGKEINFTRLRVGLSF